MAGSSGQIMIGKSILRSRLSAEIMIDVDCTICFFSKSYFTIEGFDPFGGMLDDFFGRVKLFLA